MRVHLRAYHTLSMRARLVLWLALACASAPAVCGGRGGGGGSAKWRARIDWDAMERELEEGDDPDLLRSEDSVAIADMERRRMAPPPADAGAEALAHAAAQAGPTMLFAGLRTGAGAGAGDALADAWTELLHTAGITASVYEVATDRLVVTLQQGWRGLEVRDFLLARDEVADVEWDGQMYTAESLAADGSGADHRQQQRGGRRRGPGAPADAVR